MKKILLIAAACCSILASCSTYQLNVVSSNGKEPNQQTGDYEFENDSLKVSYSFYGEDAPVTVNVYNKLNQPLYVDWQQSALIVGDKAISYVPESISLNGSISTQSYSYLRNNKGSVLNPTYTDGSVNAVANLPKTTTFLPPHAQSSITTLHLTNGFLYVPDTAFRKDKMMMIDQEVSNTVRVKRASFDLNNSPLTFRSYITTYTMVDGKQVISSYEHQFYISQTINSGTSPDQFYDFHGKRGNYFINSKATGYGKTMAVVGAAAVIGTASAISDSQNAKSK